MSNEARSSSQTVYNQGLILPVDPATRHLLNRVQNLNDNTKFSPIYVVSEYLRDVKPSSFSPRVVSIGPLHKGLSNLKSVESKKPTYLKELLLKVGATSMEETLDKCVKKVRGSIQEIRSNYFGMKTYSDNKLVQMMVMDGCYILRFIDNLSARGNLFSENRLRSRNIALDLVLLENQIPFFVLENLYDLTVQKFRPGSDLTKMIKVLLDYVNPFDESLRENIELRTRPHHILGLLHKFYKPISADLNITAIPTTHSATELDNFGMKIKPNKSLTWALAMEFGHSSFWQKPALNMPVVRIDNFFEVVLRNLIAYEQYSPVENYVTSYAMAMNMLVATPADIAKLGKSGVIVNHLGSNEKASEMISSICKNVNLQDFYYMKPWKNIDQYCNSYWLRNFGVFKGTYINTPWKVIALAVAIIVFLMSVVQFFRLIIKPFLG